MKFNNSSIAAAFAVGAAIATCISVKATPPAAGQASPSFLPSVRTTKILAVGHLTPKASLVEVQRTMRLEVKETVKLYLAGTIDSWYMRKDKPGVVFLLNLTKASDASKVLEELPLGKAGLMEFELTPVGPLAPLGALLDSNAKPESSASKTDSGATGGRP